MPHFFTSSSLTSAGSHLRVDGLSFSYADRRVLTDISFVVPAGDRVGLIGENGSGKSTLLRAVAGVLEPDTGAVTINAPHDENQPLGCFIKSHHSLRPRLLNNHCKLRLLSHVARAQRSTHSLLPWQITQMIRLSRTRMREPLKRPSVLERGKSMRVFPQC